MKELILALFTSSILLAHSSISDEKSTIAPIAMSQEYSSTTQTIKTSLLSFKDWVINAIETHQDELKKNIDKHRCIVISDIGCFDGGNFFEPLKEVIAKLRDLFGNDFEIKVIYSDLSKDPGGFTKQILETPELLGINVKTAYYQHNFYLPLPYLSDITLCTLGTHWLSTSTLSQPSSVTLFPTCFKPETSEHTEISQIADMDLKTFFKARQQDTSVFLGLVNMVKIKNGDEKISFTAQSAMEHMDRLFFEKQRQGDIVPFYYRFPEKFLASAKTLGYHIERAETFIFPCDYVKLYKQEKISREQLIDSETKMARAWSEGSMAHLVGKDRVEDYYAELRGCFEKSAETSGSDYHLQFLILHTPTS